MTTSTLIDKKLWPFFILRVLEAHAEDGAERNEKGERFLTQKQILEFLQSDYGIVTQRKATLDNLVRLQEVGMLYPELGFELESLDEYRRCAGDVDAVEEMRILRKGWRLVRDTEFDTSEVRLLIDATIASSIIRPTQVKQLVRRLRKLSPDKIPVPNIEHEGRAPAVNSEFFLNLELLNEAIQKRRLVKFILGSFGRDKKLHRKGHDGMIREYVVAPVQLLVSKGHHYLLATKPGDTDMIKFRIDRIRGVEVLDKKASNAQQVSDINIVKFRERHSYMMSGEVMTVVLRVSKDSLHTLFDQFGSNVNFGEEHEETVDVQLKSSLYSVLFWALQYYRYVEVVSPAKLRDMLEKAGRVITDMYAGEPGAVDLETRQTE